MNKRHGMIAVALVALLLITGCSTFFTGAVSGSVSCDGSPITGATVALYFDAAQRDADYNAANKVFNTQFKTETGANGRFSIPNIPWDSAFPEYGKDADSRTACALVYHQDYGYLKVDGITIISDRPNEFFPEFDKEIYKEETIKLSFINAANTGSSSGISSFSYAYKGRPGLDEDEWYKVENVSVPTTGPVDIRVKYDARNDKPFPEVKIYDIKASKYDINNDPYAKPVVFVEDHYEAKDEFMLTFGADDKRVYSIQVMPYIIELSGFSGRIHVADYLENDIEVSIALKSDASNKLDAVIAQPGKSDNLDNAKFYAYEGLGKGITIKNTELKKDFSKEFNIVLTHLTEPIKPESIKATRTVKIKAAPKASDYTQTFSI